MKKSTLLLLAFTVLGTLQMRAQYFQHLYGTTSSDVLWDGINKVLHGQGYVMTGTTRNATTGLNSVLISSTDINGDVIPGPYFNQEHVISNNNGSAVDADNIRVFEYPAGFGIIGRYTDLTMPAPNTGIFYMKLSPTGIVMNIYSYPIIDPNQTIIEVGYMDESSIGDFAYVCGAVRNSISGNINHFAMKIDENTGIMMWGHVYAFQAPIFDARARDIIENPTNSQDIVMVGISIDNLSMDGFIAHVNAMTGFPQLNDQATLPSSDDFYQCVAKVTSGNPGQGFIIGGGTNQNGSTDFLITRTDPLGNVLLSNAFDYSASPGSFNYCNDVIERITPTGDYTYFAVGGDINGIFGGYDRVTLKLDNLLNPLPGGEFTYGGTGHDWGGVFDMYNLGTGAPPDGLSTFGAWNAFTTGEQMYFVRSYFNGVSGCNERFNTATAQPGLPTHHIPSPSIIGSFRVENLNESTSTYSDATLCFSATLPTGSNALVKQEPVKQRTVTPTLPDVKNPIHPAYIPEPASAKIAVKTYPNPARDHFSIRCDQSIVSHVRVYNIAGQLMFEQKVTPTKEIIVNSDQWSEGLYIIKVYANEQLLHTQKLVKTN